MDEVGVIIKKITEDGMLKFGFVGGVDPRVVIGRPVRFGDVPGVIGIKAVHLTTAAERRTMPKTKISISTSARRAALPRKSWYRSAITAYSTPLLSSSATASSRPRRSTTVSAAPLCSACSRTSRPSTPGSASPCRRKPACAARRAWRSHSIRALRWCSRVRRRPTSPRSRR